MNYTDLYLRTDSLEDLADLIDLEEFSRYYDEDLIDLKEFSGYYENELFVLDWIGRIPAETDEEGNVTAWVDGEHFNVRLKSVENPFSGFTDLAPATPHRTFYS